MASSDPKHVQGSQTLARGLLALEYIAESPDGLTGTEVSRALDVHQSIAYRVLQTLVQFRLVRRDLDGRYRIGLSVLNLARAARSGLRSLAMPIIKNLTQETGATAWLFMEEGNEAVALLAVEPSAIAYANRFLEGSRHPIDRGSAGYALLSLRPPSAGESTKVTEARDNGYVVTYGEIAATSWGAAAPLDVGLMGVHACINLASSDKQVIDASIPFLQKAVREISEAAERASA
jgi:DNA-binding IclR family transcriptional regulator